MNQHYLHKGISVHMGLVLVDEIEFRLYIKALQTADLVSIMHVETPTRAAN